MPPIPNVLRAFCLLAAICLSPAMAWASPADSGARATWTTGIEFQRRLSQPVDVFWSGNPLRAAIKGLAGSQQVAILLDRRVDPGQKLDLTAKDVPLESALRTIAERCKLGVARLGSIIYLGPPSAARRLRPAAAALNHAVRRLPADAQRKFLRTKAMAWEDLAKPRDLLAQLGRQNDIEIGGLERVPHDLWAAADLPPASLVDRLTLIAVQFDLTFNIAQDGDRIELVPVPDNLPVAGQDGDGLPGSRKAVKPRTAEPVVGIDRTRIGRLSVQAQPLGAVLRQLADGLGLRLRIDEDAVKAASISLDQRITVTIENANVVDAFRQLLKSTGLTFRRRNKVVEIRPAATGQ
jgi:hypothetical protein